LSTRREEEEMLPPPEERRVIDIDYFEDNTFIAYLSDGTKAHGIHSFLIERGFTFDNQYPIP
jgi:hypothetical protein